MASLATIKIIPTGGQVNWFFYVRDSLGAIVSSSTTPNCTLVLEGIVVSQAAMVLSNASGYVVTGDFSGITSQSTVQLKISNVTIGGVLQPVALIDCQVVEVSSSGTATDLQPVLAAVAAIPTNPLLVSDPRLDDYATNTVVAQGFAIFDSHLATAQQDIIAGVEVQLLDDATGGAFIAAIANSVTSFFDQTSDAIPQVFASAVRTELSVEMGRIDANVSAPKGLTPAQSNKLDNVLSDTNQLQLNQGDWTTATGFATPGDVTTAANLVITTGNTGWATGSGGSGGGLTATQATQLSDILADTSDLQANQNNWTTATGFASPGDVSNAEAAVIAVGNAGWTTGSGSSGSGLTAAQAIQLSDILADTSELQSNQSQWTTATGFATPGDVATAANLVITTGNTGWVTGSGGSGGGLTATQATQLSSISTDALAAKVASQANKTKLDAATGVLANTNNADMFKGSGGGGGAGSGARVLTVLVRRASDQALVSGARVSLVNTTVAMTTGTSGEALIALDDGAYDVRVLPPSGFDSVADTSVVLSGADQSLTIDLTAVPLALPATPEQCMVVVDVIDQQGNPMPGVHVTAVKVGSPAFASDALISHQLSDYVTDAAGRVTMPLIRESAFNPGTNASYKIATSIHGRTTSFVFTVPDDPTAVATAVV